MTRACLQPAHIFDSATQKSRSLSWQLRPGHRLLVDRELVAQGEVLKSELAVAAAEEREEMKQVDEEGDHWQRFSPDRSRQINCLAAA